MPFGRDDFTVWVAEVLGRIDIGRDRYIDWQFSGRVYDLDTPWPHVRFRIQYDEPDTYDGKVETQYGRWWYIENDMDEEAIIKTVWLAITVSDEHVRREWFKVDGEQIFSPHNGILNNGKKQKPSASRQGVPNY